MYRPIALNRQARGGGDARDGGPETENWDMSESGGGGGGGQIFSG